MRNNVNFGIFNNRINLHDVSRDQVSKLKQVKTYEQKFISLDILSYEIR